MMSFSDGAHVIVDSAIALLKMAGRIVVDRLTVMKTAYLIERKYFLTKKERLTNLTYYKYVYGPYNGLIINRLEELASENRIEKESDYEYNISFYNPKNKISEEISKEVVKVLKTHKYSFNLVDYVHNFKEVKETIFGEEIRFENAI